MLRFAPMRGSLVVMALFSAALSTVRPASADAASAQKLFDEGKKLLDAGDWTAACKKFRVSMQMDTSLGTLLNIGNCNAHEGKVHSAQNDFEDALKMNRNTADPDRKKSVDKYAREKIAELLERVPTLEVEVEPRPKGLKVSRNGVDLPVGALGEALPFDPGLVEVRAEAPGWQGQGRIRLEERQHEKLRIKLHETADEPSGEEGGSVPVWSWVTMGAGVALGAVSLGFFVDYSNVVGVLKDKCGEGLDNCGENFEVEPLNDRKNQNVVVGGVLAGVGGAALVTGIIGAIVGASSGKDDASSSPAAHVGVQLGSGLGGLQLYGRFE